MCKYTRKTAALFASIMILNCGAVFAQEMQAEQVQPETESPETTEEDSFSHAETADNENDSKLYKINKVDFHSKGKTKEWVVENTISDIKYNKIFKGTAEFENYLNDITQELDNTRQLEKIRYVYNIVETKDDVNLVDVKYTFSDSHSLIVFPKPSLDSNSGFELKLKLKDTNFLGLMNALNTDLNMQFGDKDDPDDWSKATVGFDFSYDFPFNFKNIKNTWANDFSFDWEISDESPEFSYKTGITTEIPLKQHSAVFSVSQSFAKENDYKDFGDEYYFKSEADVSIPLTLGYIGNTTKVTYTPGVSISYYWDKDGISEDNTDLNQNPYLSIYQKFGASQVNWVGKNNLRTGYSLSSTQSFGWNFNGEDLNDKVCPSVSATMEIFKSFGWMGLAVNINAFGGLNSTTKIGPDIRGALDNQHFSDDYDVDSNNYALETSGSIVFNFDMPIHIITTHWLDWSHALFGDYDTKPTAVKVLAFIPHKLFKYVDFEMQFNPFVDIALFANRGTGANFDYREGIYTGGLEVLVYPAKWRSFVVRGSLGYDVGRKFLDGHFGIDSDWRDPSKMYEIYFGLGLQF